MPTPSEITAIQLECCADDVPLLNSMESWTVSDVQIYFHSGGVTVPAQPVQKPNPAVPRQTSTVGGSMYGMSLPDVERLSERVVVVRGLNPGFFTGPGTNTYIIGVGKERVLIDAGDAQCRRYIELLKRTLDDVCDGARISRILITHSHPDHIGGAAAAAAACGIHGQRTAYLKVPWPGNDGGLSIEKISDGHVVQVDDSTTLRAHFTPGHAPDHTCWSLEEEGTLFSGDNVLGAGTVIVPADGGSMRLYLQSLRRLAERDWAAIFPGHGPPIRGRAARQAIVEYIGHREQRETQILHVLDRLGSGGASPPELVHALYADKVLSFELRQAAAETVYNHLLFLHEKGQARPMLSASSSTGLASRWIRG